MLELLLKYANDHGIETEPGFGPKDIRWAIVCDDAGRFLDVVELGATDSKRNPGETFPKCPDLNQPEMVAGGEVRSHFLADAAEVIALYGNNADVPKIAAKHEYFKRLLKEAGSSMPELMIGANLLSDNASLENIRESLAGKKARSTDKVTLKIGDSFPLESDAWHEWWRTFRKRLAEARGPKGKRRKNKNSGSMRCIVSGEMIKPLATHPKIEGLSDVGGHPAKDVLIGFDKDAFCSYGLEQSANAAVSEEAASAYTGALNILIREHGQRLAGMKVIHWFKKKVKREDDPLAWLDQGADREEINAQKRAGDLLKSIRSGEKTDLFDNHFYALTLSGASGRIMVRDWMEGQFEELVRNIAEWFRDMEIVNLTGSRIASSPGIERVITCLLPPRKTDQKYIDWIKPIGSERLALWHSAVRGEIIPSSSLCRIVRLNNLFHLCGTLEEATESRNNRNAGMTISLLHTRMALIKAYHLRRIRQKGRHYMSEELKPYLNEVHPDPGYHCGRLMAVLARLQHSALGDVGAGVVQRYYAAASTTPALVLGRLTKTSQFHLNKLQPGLAHWYEDQIAAIMGRIKDNVPATLGLEAQSLFALGYYQQIAEMRKGKSQETEDKQ